MSRRFSVLLAFVWLFSFLALGFGTVPVNAATTYELTATQVYSDPYSPFSSFRLQYVDGNENGQFDFDLNELVPLTFSGLVYHVYSETESGPVLLYDVPLVQITYVSADMVPGRLGWAPRQWDFLGSTDPYDSWPGFPAPGDFWNYSQQAVPLPSTALLLGSGLIPLVWARRKKQQP
jgi:hypothetical protein